MEPVCLVINTQPYWKHAVVVFMTYIKKRTKPMSCLLTQMLFINPHILSLPNFTIFSLMSLKLRHFKDLFTTNKILFMK